MITVFKLQQHRKLWELVKHSWKLVQEFGLIETKTYLRRSELNDYEDIPNSCYACAYAEQKHKEDGGLVSKCKFCPIDVGMCGDFNSVYRRICESIVAENQKEFEILCDMMINAKVRPGIEVNEGETHSNNPATI